MVKTEKVELGVTRLLSFQDNLKLCPLLTYKIGCPLDDVVGLDGCRLKSQKSQDMNPNVLQLY